VNFIKFGVFVSVVVLNVLIAGTAYSDPVYSDTYVDRGAPPPVQPEDVPKNPSGLGILIVPNCNPIHFQTNSDMAPYGAGGSGMGLACNPSDLSGPSQNPANVQSQAEQDTSQPPPTNSAYFYGGSSLSSPERPNGGGIYPQLYPPNSSQGTIEYNSGTGKDHGEGAQSSIAGINPQPGENMAQANPEGPSGNVAPNVTQQAGQVASH
jgi:hypothetical protein